MRCRRGMSEEQIRIEVINFLKEKAKEINIMDHSTMDLVLMANKLPEATNNIKAILGKYRQRLNNMKCQQKKNVQNSNKVLTEMFLITNGKNIIVDQILDSGQLNEYLNSNNMNEDDIIMKIEIKNRLKIKKKIVFECIENGKEEKSISVSPPKVLPLQKKKNINDSCKRKVIYGKGGFKFYSEKQEPSTKIKWTGTKDQFSIFVRRISKKGYTENIQSIFSLNNKEEERKDVLEWNASAVSFVYLLLLLASRNLIALPKNFDELLDYGCLFYNTNTKSMEQIKNVKNYVSIANKSRESKSLYSIIYEILKEKE